MYYLTNSLPKFGSNIAHDRSESYVDALRRTQTHFDMSHFERKKEGMFHFERKKGGMFHRLHGQVLQFEARGRLRCDHGIRGLCMLI